MGEADLADLGEAGLAEDFGFTVFSALGADAFLGLTAGFFLWAVVTAGLALTAADLVRESFDFCADTALAAVFFDLAELVKVFNPIWLLATTKAAQYPLDGPVGQEFLFAKQAFASQLIRAGGAGPWPGPDAAGDPLVRDRARLLEQP